MADICGITQAVTPEVTVPSLIFLYIFFILINLFIGLAIVKNSRQKFMLIWGLTIIFSLVALIGISLMPNMVSSVYSSITTFFGGLK